MKTTIRRIGNSEGVIIPKAILAVVGRKDEADMVVERGAIVLRQPRKARAGWAEASKQIAAAGEDLLVWPELGPDGAGEFACS